MSDENKDVIEQPEEEIVAQVGFVKKVKDAIVAGATKDVVYNSFLGGLISEKVTQRANMLKKALETLIKHAGELNKIRPKSAGFDEKEIALPKTYAAEDMKKRKELKEKSQRLETAIEKALDPAATENEWVALDNAISKNS